MKSVSAASKSLGGFLRLRRGRPAAPPADKGPGIRSGAMDSGKTRSHNYRAVRLDTSDRCLLGKGNSELQTLHTLKTVGQRKRRPGTPGALA